MRKLLIWLIVLVVAIFWLSKSCNNSGTVNAGIEGVSETAKDAVSAVGDKAKSLTSIGDEEESDGDGKKGSYDIDEENDAVGEDKDLEDDEEDETGNIVDDEEEDNEAEEEEDEEEDNRLADRSSSVSSYSDDSDSGSSDGKYLVVAGSFRHEENAAEMVSKLKKLGHDGAEIFSFDFSEFYSVTTGRYSSDSKAKSVAEQLEGKGISAYSHRMRSKYFD